MSINPGIIVGMKIAINIETYFKKVPTKYWLGKRNDKPILQDLAIRTMVVLR